MKIFLSYASEERAIAERIAVGLRREGHTVFFDRDDLPASEAFDVRIRDAVGEADLMVFLVSPDSVKSGAYALTELGFARRRWKDPANRVLSALAVPTPIDDVPGYLRSVGILQPEGDLVAEVLARVDSIADGETAPRRRIVRRVVVIASVAVAAAFWWFGRERLPSPVPGVETTVKGELTDRATESAVVGATVEVMRGDKVLATGNSDLEGRFSLPVEVNPDPKPQNLTLAVRHTDYVSLSQVIVITSGRTDSSSYELELLPKALTNCIMSRDHGVIVGHFGPAASVPSGDFSDLSNRIAIALTYNLLPRIQQLHMPLDFQPFFQACEEARPRSIIAAGGFAEALGADAFVSGFVSQSGDRYRVDAYVGDPYDLFVPPLKTSNDDVDLDDPSAADFDRSTHAAILTALAAGYEKEGKTVECVEVTVVAEHVLGGLSPAIEETRRRCQGALVNAGLLEESP
jgi:hypothetical protein